MIEQSVSSGFIHLTHKIIGINDNILSEFVIKSEKARESMWNSVNGPHLLIVLLNKKDHKNNAKIFDTLVSWLKVDAHKIEDYL